MDTCSSLLFLFAQSLTPRKDEIDQGAHLLCADGTIFEIEKGGRAACKAASPTDTTLRDFYVHV